MKVFSIALGDFQTNSFCVRKNAETRDCVIIDTGLNSSPLVDYIKQNDLNPVALLYTHGHFDHIEGVNIIRENWPDIKVAIHKADAEMFTDPEANISSMLGLTITADPAEIIIDQEQPVEFAGITFEVLHTPGHTPGGICFYVPDENTVFVGDTLFSGSIGRTDFPGGNYDQLIQSIKTKLMVLPDQTVVYNGHGPSTTIGQEKNYNQYLQ